MQLKDNNVLPVTIATADEFGNITNQPFDTAPVWTSSDDTVVAVEAGVDGLTANIKSPAGKLAAAVVQVAGVVAGKPVLGSLAIEIIVGDTAEILIAPGTPTPV